MQEAKKTEDKTGQDPCKLLQDQKASKKALRSSIAKETLINTNLTYTLVLIDVQKFKPLK